MKPRKLKIQGLNSFIEEQEVDFEKLTERGFFGIFGPTGSGKSTILDAITIAMYGRIARGSSDYINSNCEQVSVSYEFEIGPINNRKIYCFDRVIKRDKNDATKYKTNLVRIIDKTDGEDLIIADKSRDVDSKVQDILGLTFEDFTRSVVLPQGKFSDFLRIPPSNRSNMLERIFGLEKYGRDLMTKVKRESEKYKAQKIDNDARINEHGDVSKEIYENKKECVNNLENEEKELQLKKKKIELKYDKYKNIWDVQKELNFYLDRMSDIKKNENEILNIRNISQLGRKSLSVMPFITRANTIKKNYEEASLKIIEITKSLEAIKNNLLNIEIEYNNIVKRKNNELPILIKKEGELNQAIEIKNEIEELLKEIKKAEIEYTENKTKLSKIQNETEQLQKDKNKITFSIDDIENNKAEVTISADYRDKIIKGADSERRINDIESEIKKFEKDIIIAEAQAKIQKEEYDNAIKRKKDLVEKIEGIDRQTRKLKEDCPGNEDTVIKESSELEEIKRNYKETSENIKIKNLIQLEINKIQNELEALKKQTEDKKLSSYNTEKNIEVSRKQIEDIKTKNMAYILATNLKEGEPCPVCGSVHHELHTNNFELEDINKFEKELKDYESKYKLIQNELSLLNSKYAACEKDYELKKQKYDEINENIKNININELEVLKNNKEENLLKLKKSIEIWKKQVEALNDELNTKKDEKSKYDALNARTNESLKNNKEKLNDLKANKEIKEKSKIEILSVYNLLSEELKVRSMIEKLNEIKKMDAKFEELVNKERAERKEISNIDSKIETLQSNIQKLNSTIVKFEEIKKAKQSQVDSGNLKLAKLCISDKPETEIIEVKNTIKFIQEKEGTIKKNLDDEKERKNKIEKEKVSHEQDEINLKRTLQESLDELNKSLALAEFENSEEVKKYSIDIIKIESMEKKIVEYEDNIKRTQSNIDMLTKKLGNESIKESEWEDIKESKVQAENELLEKSRELTRQEKELDILKKSLDEVEKLMKTKKIIDHNIDLISSIEKVIRSNKFVDFVGLNQLKYVAKTATQELNRITRGRYALEIGVDGSFVICDNYNGGIRRSTDTLSGGELFVTSLSLALALSTQIQLRNNASLEFFFLDEGFGTLDNDLLDIVMTSLESLHTERLCVGIISHVEELKSRVPVRLVLEPSREGHGTVIQKPQYN